MLAQTWVYEPHTLLMDEPFGALDALLRTQLQGDLLEMWERDRKTILFVTHDLRKRSSWLIVWWCSVQPRDRRSACGKLVDFDRRAI